MYGQIYTLPFKSIEENDYLVVIEKDGFTGTSTELTGSTSPFTVETSLDSPLSPYRLSTATLRIFGGDYLQSLFTPNPQGVRVKLLKNGSVEWIGFVTNDVYSQDYSSVEFEYEIELVNPLSTLKYKKFVNNGDLVTFYQLVVDSIKATNSEIKKLYLSTSITNSLNQNIYELISTASANYIDEQDEPMKYYEILEEIAKYLCLTITIDKDSVYFIDYTGISKGYNQYYEYTFDSSYVVSKTANPITLSNSNTIQLLDYSGDSSTLQINSGKNKVKVTCSLYDIDELIPSFDDEGTEFRQMVEQTQAVGEDTYKKIIRTYASNKITFHKYMPSMNWLETANKEPVLIGDDYLFPMLGSGFVKYVEFPIEETPSSLDFDNRIIVQRKSPATGLTLSSINKIFSFKSSRSMVFTPSVNFAINFDIASFGAINSFGASTTTFDVDTIKYVKVMLRIGQNWYNGTSWQTTETTFNVPIDCKEGSPVFQNFFSVKNTVVYEDGFRDMEGYLINSVSQTVFGDVELVFYDSYIKLDNMNTPNIVYFKDIKLKSAIPNDQVIYDDWIDEENSNDAVYENVISDDYVEEADEIELKICTFPEGYTKLNYSSTFTSSDYLKTLLYSPLTLTDRPENIIINKVVGYYTNPKFQVTIPVINKPIYPYSLITDSNLSGKKFIYAGNEIDYEFEKNNITLIEI